MSFTTVWYVRNGFPRQLMVMNENSRCSILFHLLVPGGKVAYGDRDPEFVSEALQLELP